MGEGRVDDGSGIGRGGRSDVAKWKKGRGKCARVRLMNSRRVETTYMKMLQRTVKKVDL